MLRMCDFGLVIQEASLSLGARFVSRFGRPVMWGLGSYYTSCQPEPMVRCRRFVAPFLFLVLSLPHRLL